MMKQLQRIQRKTRLLFSIFIPRKLVVTRHPDGSPELVIRYRGDERLIREISRTKYPDPSHQNPIQHENL
jgi:hypothetical protein